MRFLLPVDIHNPGFKSASLASCIGKGLGERLEKVTILTVLAGKYLREHIKNIDTRAGRLIESEFIRALRQEHIERDILPVLAEIKAKLAEAGIGRVDEFIEDGDPSDKILEYVNKRGYTHVFLDRRGVGTMQAFFLGSVTRKLLHSELRASIYLIGEKLDEKMPCKMEHCLIPVDGSHHSSLALKEAGLILGNCIKGVKNIELLHVINLAKYPERLENGHFPEKDGEKFLNEGKELLKTAGIPESCISMHMEYGHPAKKIIERIESKDVDLVFMGRRGRDAIQEFFIGSVTSEIVHKSTKPTFALVTEY